MDQLIFAGHPLLEKAFILLGGLSIIVHFVTQGIPRFTAMILGIALSQDHPALRKALEKYEQPILDSIEAAKATAKDKIDAAVAQDTVKPAQDPPKA